MLLQFLIWSARDSTRLYASRAGGFKAPADLILLRVFSFSFSFSPQIATNARYALPLIYQVRQCGSTVFGLKGLFGEGLIRR
jgi:hypothetical protein